MRDEARALISEISEALGPNRPKAAPGSLGSPDFWLSRTGPEDVPRFREVWESLGGEGHIARDVGAARAQILEILSAERARTAVRWEDPLLDEIFGPIEGSLDRFGCRIEPVHALEPRAERIARTAQADAGIIRADFAIAQTGTLVHRSGGGRLKSVSLIPPVLIALVERSRVVDILSAALGEMRGWLTEPGESQGVQLISGPSRSSDIENELTIGVHGPGRVHAVIIG